MNIKKPLIDNKEYKYIKLSNDLNVIIINDKNAERSAASMSINVGFKNDTVPGIAHFLEHMLFMGTKKYPKENYYFEFINKHGGSSNAGTSYDKTTYYFDILSDKFLECLNIFSSFFIEPLFSSSSINREINAVNSEHNKNLNNDIRRIFRLFGEIINTDHTLKKFGTGNTETLNINNIRHKLINFYNNNYSSNIMTLVVLSNYSISNMEKIITKLFSKIKNKNFIKNKNNILPFKFNNDKNILVNSIPIKNNHDLLLIWQVNNEKDYYKYKAYDYIGYLLESENKNSLYEYLYNLGLIIELEYYKFDYDNFSLIHIDLQLTDNGFDNIQKIIKIIENFIDEFIISNFYLDIYNDIRKINNLYFKYKDNEEPIDYVSGLSSSFHKYEIQDLIYGPYKILELNDINISKIKKIISNINFKNKVIIISSKKNILKNKKIEKWYNIEYSVDYNYKFDFNLENNLSNYIKYFKNNFIPQNTFLLNNKSMKYPKLMKNNDFNLWYKFDTKFKIPRVYITFILSTFDIYKNIDNYTNCLFFLDVFNTEFNKINFDPNIAGYSYNINLNRNDLVVTINGYSDNIKQYVNFVFNHLINLEIKKNTFDIRKKFIIKLFDNYKFNEPYKHLNEFLKENIFDIFYKKNDCLKSLKKIKFDKFNNILGNVIKNIYLKCLVQGNISKNNSKEIFNDIYNQIFDINNIKKLNISNCYNFKLIKNIFFKKNKIEYINYNLDKNNINSAIKVIYCIEYIKHNKKYTNNWSYILCLLYIFNKIISEPFFNELRTNEQLGYIVKSFIDVFGSNRYPFYCYSLLIQSDKKNPTYLKNRIISFVDSFKNKLNDYSDSQFKTFIKTIKLNLKEKDISMSDNFYTNLKQVMNSDYKFNFKDKIFEVCKLIKKEDIINFYNTYFFSKNDLVKIIIVGSKNNNL